MAASTFQDWYDPDGIDAFHGISPPGAPRRRAAPQGVDAHTSQIMSTGWTPAPIRTTQKPLVANTAAPAQINYAAQQSQWMNQMRQRMTQPSAQQAASGKTSPKPTGLPMTSGQSSGQKEESPPQQTQVAYQQPSQGTPNMIGQLHGQHFGHHNNMVAGVNAAMSGAAQQWSDAAARNQAFRQRSAEVNQANQMEMAKMQSQERMNQAEMQDRKEKRKAIMGMMGGISPIGRSLLG